MKNTQSNILKLLGTRSWKSLSLYILIFVLLITPVTYLTYAGYNQQAKSFIQLSESERENIVAQGDLLIEERFTKLTDIAKSLASRVRMREMIKEGNWQEAVTTLKEVPPIYHEIERIFLADKDGILMADTPEAPGDVRGRDFSYRDWYVGVAKNWEPYVSEAFQRAALPAYNVVNVATPIWSEGNELLGILVLQIKLDIFEQWAKNVDIRSGGFLYLVDQHGHAIAHPDYPSSGPIPDLSAHPPVSKVLEGLSGTQTYTDDNGEEIIADYKVAPRFGWGVILEQKAAKTFSVLELTLIRELFLELSLIIFSIIVISLIIAFIRKIYASEQQQQAMLQGIGDGVIAIDRDLTIRVWNPMAEKITGFSSAEALGKPFRKIVKFLREDNHEENITFLEETMLYGKIRNMTNHTVVKTKDGRFIPVADSAAPLFDQNGKVSGAIIVFRDITKERELEASKDEFISIASHQLRTPLTGMKWILESMHKEKKSMTAKQSEYLSDLETEVRRLIDLVAGLLNTSRIDLGTFAVKPEQVDLTDLARESLKEIQPSLKAKQIEVKTNFEKDLPLLKADPKLITIIFQNLLSNALKFSAENGSIQLSIHKKDAYIEIRVKDNGVGIPKEQESQIFSKMFRAANAQNIEGTGLGLYMVKSIIELSKGKIWFESKEGKGTTFIVQLPLSGMEAREGKTSLG